MKIWSQSCSPLTDLSRADYVQSLNKHVHNIARPDTVVEFHGAAATQIPATTSSHTGLEVCGWLAVKNAIHAEHEGYDAFMVASALDSGYYRLQEMVDMPVAFMIESSIHIALMLAHKFAFLTISPMMLLRLMEIAKRYELDGRMVEGEWIDISYKTIFAKTSIFKDPAPNIAKATNAIEKLVSRGADVILTGPVPISMFLLEQNIREINGTKILDMYGCTLKMAEMMVDLKKAGITRCKHGLFAAPPKDLMPALQKLYQIDWQW